MLKIQSVKLGLIYSYYGSKTLNKTNKYIYCVHAHTHIVIMYIDNY